MVDVICDVVANPNVEAFHWAFNNSAGLIHVPASRSVSVNGTRSKLTYTPKNNKDYGTLMCGAKNEVGKQKHPCIFHIILAGEYLNFDQADTNLVSLVRMLKFVFFEKSGFFLFY